MTGLKNWFEVIPMRIEIKGLIVLDYIHKFGETMEVFKKALAEGKIKLDDKSEHVIEAKFEDVPVSVLPGREGRMRSFVSKVGRNDVDD